jgi:ferredoxin
MNKNLNLLFFSATENTKTYLKTIASKLNDHYIEYDITGVEAREKKLEFSKNDLLIIGAPVYAGRIPKFLVNYFEKIRGDNTPAVFIVTYGNRDYDDALLELKDIFESNGFRGIAAGAFIGEHSNSKKIAGYRPDQKDINYAEKFGDKIKAKVNRGLNLGLDSKLEVKGNYPYKERHDSPAFAPQTADSCIDCAICAKSCPVNAISFKNFSKIDKEKCINCCSCIQKCPVDAKYMDHPHFEEITEYLIENFAEKRKENETFI